MLELRYNKNHGKGGRFASGGSGALGTKIEAEGGFTLNPSTGTFPTKGIAVAMPGHSEIMSAERFKRPGEAEKFVGGYIRKMRDDGVPPDVHVGAWHDKKHGEIVLDRVKVYPKVNGVSDERQPGVIAGRLRGEQSVYDLGSGREIPTGGSGGREGIDIQRHLRGTQADEALVGDDRRGDRRTGGRTGRTDALEALIQLRFNPHHGKGGRFASGGGAGAGGIDVISGSAGGGIAGEATMGSLPEDIQAKVSARFATDMGVTPAEGQANVEARVRAAIDKGTAEESSKWYQQAHDHDVAIAKETGLHPEVAHAVMAAASPGMKWENNVKLGDAIMVHASKNPKLDGAHVRTVNAKIKSANAKNMAKYEAAKAAYPGRVAAAKAAGKPVPKPPVRPKPLATIKAGSRFNDVKDAHTAACYMITSQRIGTQSYDGAAKAIKLARVNDPKTIDAGLNGEKVRSFYNNMSEPTTSLSVTIDRHMNTAIVDDHTPDGAARATHVGDAASALTGSPSYNGAAIGAYPQSADVVRAATATINSEYGTSYLPSQIQAIAWVEEIG